MIIKKALNKEDWKQKYYYAFKSYGHSQTLIDVPSVKGVQSFTYTRNNGDVICVYYENKIK